MTTYVPGTLEKDLKKYAYSLQQLGPGLDTATTNIATNATNITALQTAGQGLTNVSGSLAVSLSKITASLSGDVALNNVANYFDGPSIAQGTSGTWFVSGAVTLNDTSAAVFDVKLWDGTTVIASAVTNNFAASGVITVALSGFLASPANNLRISVKDATNTTGKILFNASGNSKDSTISAIRIA